MDLSTFPTDWLSRQHGRLEVASVLHALAHGIHGNSAYLPEFGRQPAKFRQIRKNSLFAGSDAGAKAVAVHLSFIATAKRNGINPVDWYADVLARINGLKTSELQQLLPQNWSPPQGP